jgi:hypothetical protein
MKQTLPKYIMIIYKVIWETQSYLVQEFNMVLEACNKDYKIKYLHFLKKLFLKSRITSLQNSGTIKL